MNPKNQRHTDGIIRVIGEGLQISMGGKDEPAFSKSELRKALNESIDYLVKGGQVALAGKVYDIKRINFQITCMLAVEAPAETWGVLMARQQGVPTDVAMVPGPSGRTIPVAVPSKEEVSRGTAEGSNQHPGNVVSLFREPSGSESGATEEGPGSEAGHVPDVEPEAGPTGGV